MPAQLAVHEECVGVWAPGASEIAFVCAFVADESAFVEDVTVLLSLRRRGGGDVRVHLALYGAAFEPCYRRSEDEVGGALYVAVLEIEARILQTCINGILIAQEAAVDEGELVALGMQGHCLSETRGVILDGEVLQGDIVALYLQGVCGKGAELVVVRQQV